MQNFFTELFLSKRDLFQLFFRLTKSKSLCSGESGTNLDTKEIKHFIPREKTYFTKLLLEASAI